ncbi:N-acetylmuramoyl-L-alanine amidase [uncultured Paenibacillus sp.]|uniref:N-acetylmuramoyl-L-alanine amidase n=1 Tax=uncultured Paenibacillus sp. TaxID=227322 RepID=UPI0028D41FA9|nr:N-acetylmuramoyl-L-alanine amidase [uncultured Paenibacillus sp.]
MEPYGKKLRGRLRAMCAAAAFLTALHTSTGAGVAAPRYERSLPEAEVLIDVGHGGIDGGASDGGILEKDINLAIAKRLYLMLGSRGIVAVMNRSGDYALSDDNRWHITRSRHRKDLSQRRQLADEIPVRLFVSLHVNWSSNHSAHGPLVLHQNEGRSALLASFIQDSLNRKQGMTREPKLGKPYYLLRRVQSPAVIVETGFLSHERDRNDLTDPREQQRIAEAIADGIRYYQITAE